MSWNPNSKKHKATHGGYRDKPTKGQVQANLDFWAGLTTPGGFKDGFKNGELNLVVGTSCSGTPKLGIPVGTQLKLKF